MREIKFRAKTIDDGKWVYGDFSHVHDTKGYPSIIPEGKNIFVSVYPLTVSQFTGLKDKNGKEIYDGDIIKSDCPSCRIGFVRWSCNTAEFEFARPDGYRAMSLCVAAPKLCEVIGNIYENPELLKVGEP